MLVLIILAGLTSWVFKKTALRKGITSPRIWVYPLALGGGLMVAAFILNVLVGVLLNGRSPTYERIYPYLVLACAVAVFLGLISRVWKQLKKLPDQTSDPSALK